MKIEACPLAGMTQVGSSFFARTEGSTGNVLFERTANLCRQMGLQLAKISTQQQYEDALGYLREMWHIV